MKFVARAACWGICALTTLDTFAVTAWAQSAAEAESGSNLLVNVVRFLGIALGFVIALVTTRFISARAEKSRTDMPQAVHVKSEGRRARQPVLVCQSGPLRGESWALEEGSLTIGREEACQVHYPKDTRSIKPQHCRLTRRGNAFTLIPLGDTFLAEEALTEERTLEPDIPFFLGEKRHEFRIVMK